MVKVAYGFLPYFLSLGIIPITIVLRDCPDHHCARGLSRPPSCSGTVPTTLVLGDCLDHSPTIARRPLSSAPCDFYSHTVERHLFFSHLDLATRLISRLLASSGTTSVRCTYWCISYRLYDDWVLNLTGNSFSDPGTTCLCHLLPGSGTKWAHFTLR